MPHAVFTLLEYLKFRTRAKNAHGLHSPFLYKLYCDVLHSRHLKTELQLLKLRREVTDADQLITFTDPKTKTRKTLSTKELAKNVASHHDFSYFLLRLINFMGYKRVLETGTSLGINAMYMAHSRAEKVITIEGAKEVAEVAHTNFDLHNLKNIHIVTGNVRDVFKDALNQGCPELVFLDADHRSETIDFYLRTIRDQPGVKCIIIHDIYWSPDMKKAWLQIVKSQEYNLTLDIFQAGIIFPDYPIEKQHFTLKF